MARGQELQSTTQKVPKLGWKVMTEEMWKLGRTQASLSTVHVPKVYIVLKKTNKNKKTANKSLREVDLSHSTKKIRRRVEISGNESRMESICGPCHFLTTKRKGKRRAEIIKWECN